MKKYLKIILIFLFAVTGAYLALTAGTVLTVHEQSVTALVGEEIQLPGYTASLFSRDMTDAVSVADPTDKDHTGTYTVTYRLSWHGIPLRTVRIPVTVRDVDAPVIETDTGGVLFVKTGEPADLSAFRVSDNYDAPENISLTVSGDYDLNTEGRYNVRITAADTGGNTAEKHLVLAVGDISESDFAPGVFDLYAYDHSGVCFSGLAEPADDGMFDRIYFVGDSNFVNMAKYKAVNPQRVLARHAMSPGTFDLPVIYGNVQTDRSALQIISEIQPEYCIVGMGLSEAGNRNPLVLADAYEQCMIRLQEACPDTTFVISSLFPVIKGQGKAPASQTEINRINYCLMKMCERIHMNMIYNSEWLTDSEGYAEKDYFLNDGFHLKAGYFSIYTDCIRYTFHFPE